MLFSDRVTLELTGKHSVQLRINLIPSADSFESHVIK